MKAKDQARIAVVIPSFRVTAHVLEVIGAIPDVVECIYVVDDACPDGSGDHVERHARDPRVRVLRHTVNGGVGAAVITGYRAAIEDGMEIVVKVDGDNQMDPALIPDFVQPILDGEADYTKGNRFFDIERVRKMPGARVFGNAVLSFMTKLSSGYWNLFDPTNGYTAIHVDVARFLPFEKISCRYFFETDMLFRLNVLRAVVIDIPMHARYADEVSNLRISSIVWEFLVKHARNFFKRIFYNYYLRDMSLASIELPIGALFLGFGLIYGAVHWWASSQGGLPTPAGTVMLAGLPILAGIQFLLGFVGYDMGAVPVRPVHRVLRRQLRNPTVKKA